MGKFFVGALLLLGINSATFAADITGMWQTIDDKTGTPKAHVEIRKEANGTYSGKVVKITPRPGYTPKEICDNCPAPYTNKHIVGLDIATGLKQVDSTTYTGGKILDPNTGNVYGLKANHTSHGNHLHTSVHLGVSALGRNQIWIRLE